MKSSIAPRLLVVSAIILTAIAAAFFLNGKKDADKQAAQAENSANASAQTSGIGALGRIEPKSRVINLSHDAGPEGVRIEHLNVSESQIVKRGDVIAVFSDHPRKEAQLQAAQARTAVLSARIRAEKANLQLFGADLSRGKKLQKARAISQSQFDQIRRNQSQSAATLESLQAELLSTQAEEILAQRELEQARLLSPIDGTILKILSWPGERVSDRGIVQIADLSQLDVVAEIYERDMPRVKIGQKAEISIPGMERKFQGTVRELGFLVEKNDLNNTDPLADRDNRIVEVRITLDAADLQAVQHLLYMQVDVRLL